MDAERVRSTRSSFQSRPDRHLVDGRDGPEQFRRFVPNGTFIYSILSTYRVEQKGGPSDPWLTESAGSIDRRFLVEDEDEEESDRILVDPAGAAISPGNESIRKRTGDALPNEVRLRLSQHQADLELEEILAGNAARSRRYAEGYIAPGDRVHVYGGQLGDSAAPGVDATVVGGDGRYRITGGGASIAAWGFVKKAAVTGSMSLVAGGGAIVALSAAL